MPRAGDLARQGVLEIESGTLGKKSWMAPTYSDEATGTLGWREKLNPGWQKRQDDL